MTCKGVCNGIPNSPKIKRYETSQKYCSECRVFQKTSRLRCECCNGLFRLKSRSNKGQTQWLKSY